MSEKAWSCSQIDSAQEKEHQNNKNKTEIRTRAPTQGNATSRGDGGGGCSQRWATEMGTNEWAHCSPTPHSPPPPAHLSLSSAHTVTTRRPLTGEK